MISALYAAAVRRRRERYARRPDLRRRLRAPVISVGNLAVGGRGKTPMVACLARMLLDMGERPAILTRGYARQDAAEGVVVVRDPLRIRADLPRAGDEPLMLARQLHGASVLAAPDRYVAGRLAEHHLGATVHLLDDGFQHVQIDRDVDIVMVGPEDLAHPMTLPTGRLREPIDTLIVADALMTLDDARVDVPGATAPVFRVRRLTGPPRTADGECPDGPAVAVAGIASPGRFFDRLRDDGRVLAQTLAFRDHHRYSRGDVRRIVEICRASGASAVITTEKDYVRLLPFRPFPVPVCWVPLTMEPEPLAEFRGWLTSALREARDIVV